MEHHRTGRHDDASPGASGPPAEVGVDPPVGELGTEPAEPVPQFASDEHARRRHRENVDPTVQLALIDLTGGDANTYVFAVSGLALIMTAITAPEGITGLVRSAAARLGRGTPTPPPSSTPPGSGEAVVA